MTNVVTDQIIELYHQICNSTATLGDTFLLYHKKDGSDVPEILDSINHEIFTDNILKELDYTPMKDTLLPGSNHFPVLKFFLDHPVYTAYWCIEDDVRFNGDWLLFFSSFPVTLKYDFLACRILRYSDKPHYFWWETFENISIPLSNSVCLDKYDCLISFNPIYRISPGALTFIDRSLKEGWKGHHEVLIPTLLHYNGFKILDFGGYGEFVLPENQNLFYNEKTFRWRPGFNKMGNEKDKLYHPLKVNLNEHRVYKISFCMICIKDKQEQLKETLLQNILDNEDYENLEFIILDYSLQSKMEQWLNENLFQYIQNGTIIYYRTSDSEIFSPGHAKNLVFKLAGGDIVCNLNSNIYTGSGFANYINEAFNWDENIFITPIDIHRTKTGFDFLNDLFGRICVKKSDFLKVKGFNEKMKIKGSEDVDFIERLEKISVIRIYIEEKCFYKLSLHEGEEYPLERIDKSPYAVLIQYVDPFNSRLIFLYKDGRFEMWTCLSNSTKNAGDYRYALQESDSADEFVIDLQGNWELTDNVKNFKFSCEAGNIFNLIETNIKDRFQLKDYSENSVFYSISDQQLINEFLNIYHDFKKKSIKETEENSGEFGKAVVFRGFEFDYPISI